MSSLSDALQAGALLTRFLKSDQARVLLTGFSSLDRFTGGLRPKEILLLAGSPQVGTTALALDIVHNLCLAPERGPICRVLWISPQTSRKTIVWRLLHKRTGVSAEQFSEGRLQMYDELALLETERQIRQTIVIRNDSRVPQIWEEGLRLQRSLNPRTPRLLVVDHLQGLHSERDFAHRGEEDSEILHTLHRFAMELDWPVLVTSKIPAAPVSFPPSLSDVGRLARLPSLILLLHRMGRAVQVHVAKNRRGPSSQAALRFRPDTCTFEEDD